MRARAPLAPRLLHMGCRERGRKISPALMRSSRCTPLSDQMWRSASSAFGGLPNERIRCASDHVQVSDVPLLDTRRTRRRPTVCSVPRRRLCGDSCTRPFDRVEEAPHRVAIRWCLTVRLRYVPCGRSPAFESAVLSRSEILFRLGARVLYTPLLLS